MCKYICELQLYFLDLLIRFCCGWDAYLDNANIVQFLRFLTFQNFAQNQEAQTQRIHDLEDNVRNLRKLLSSREVEVHDLSNELKELKMLNQQLTQELDAAKMREQRSSPAYSNIQEVKHQNSLINFTKWLKRAEVLNFIECSEQNQFLIFIVELCI